MYVDNFSWVIPGKLAGCAIPDFGPGDDAAKCFAENGVSAVVSLIMPYGPVEKECERHGIEWIYYPIPDFYIPENKQAFAKLIGRIIELMTAEKGVCVHCHAGIGRTGLVLACAVGKFFALNYDQAVAVVRKVRTAIETPQQEMFIKDFLEG